MAGNTIGNIFQVTTFGESHGIAIGCIIDGVPPGMPLKEEDIQKDLDKRKPGFSRYTTQRKEKDQVNIISGIFNNITTGTPITLIIKNEDCKSKDYNKIKNLFRPGHADYTYEKKYGIRDYRGGGRSSARETVARVAAGAIAKKLLKLIYKIKIQGCITQIGNILCEIKNWDEVEKNYFFCPDPDKLVILEKLLKDIKKSGNSIGAKITVVAKNVPVGLGEPVFDRLDADLAHAFMSINAVKGVEIGDGFSVINKLGNECRDEINNNGFQSNHAGGILGGISSGQDIIAHLAFKPTSSIKIPGKTINKNGQEEKIIVTGRHDPCVGLRAVPIVESMMAIVLMDHLMRYKAQCFFKFS